MTKYLETEQPISITTARNVLQYYPQAGKLSVSRPVWQDENGIDHQGKTVALDVVAFIECDRDKLIALQEIFRAIARVISDRLTLLQ